MTGYSAPRPIREDDDVSGFDSGEPTLDDYLRTRALANHVEGASRCYVTCRDGRVVGFYALASGSVQRRLMAGPVRRNIPDPIPVILLSRLAVDSAHQGNGVGRNLVKDAVVRSVRAADLIGARAILVHAINDGARDFYSNVGFDPSPTDPLHLILSMKDARQFVPNP